MDSLALGPALARLTIGKKKGPTGHHLRAEAVAEVLHGDTGTVEWCAQAG